MLVSCLPGVRRQRLLEAFHQIRIDLENVSSGADTNHNLIHRYLRWVNDSARTLYAVVSEADVVRLLRTDSYRITMSSIGNLAYHHAEEAVSQVVRLELEQRAKSLGEVVAEVERVARRWSGSEVFLVPDTSFFIKDPSVFDRRDLSPTIGAGAVPIRIVVPILVLDELDKLKDQRVRGQAQRSLAVISKHLTDPREPVVIRTGEDIGQEVGGDRGDILLELLLDPPGHVRDLNNDDELIARALAVQSFADRDITFITFDTGQSMRGRAAQLYVVKPPIPDGGEKL